MRKPIKIGLSIHLIRAKGYFHRIDESGFMKRQDMARGTVKSFNATMVFGVIQSDNGGPDVFVHISALERPRLRDLPDGRNGSFDVVVDARRGKSRAEGVSTPAIASRIGLS
jgi:CspA family cold shock protein